ncbi:MarR family transcriptional regulator [Glycomyces arizonensis]|uniref:MarR family transcriptional regulator n=1 Tax=Glycomyces arizonensis TaxID=256035 RepID=UPI0004176E22|nr:MarR family transcriptional regulator [Glycomyces arizonensis]
MELKWEIAKAVLASKMPPPMRLIMLVFLDGAGLDGVIPARFTPSLTDLVNRTGLGRGTVADRLNDLEAGGWVKRDRPTVAEARSGVRTRYALAVGDPKAGVKPTKKDVSVPPGSSSPGAGLVREPDQDTTAPSPGAGPDLVREPDGGSPGAGPDLVREPDGKDTHLPTLSHQNPPRLSEPLPIDAPEPPEPVKSKRNRYDDPAFGEFWAAYPRKDDKKKAWSAWKSAVKDTEAADIIAGAQRYRDDPNRDPKYTKLPTSWLNAGSWENGSLPERQGRNVHQPYQDPDRSAYHQGSI